MLHLPQQLDVRQLGRVRRALLGHREARKRRLVLLRRREALHLHRVQRHRRRLHRVPKFGAHPVGDELIAEVVAHDLLLERSDLGGALVAPRLLLRQVDYKLLGRQLLQVVVLERRVPLDVRQQLLADRGDLGRHPVAVLGGLRIGRLVATEGGGLEDGHLVDLLVVVAHLVVLLHVEGRLARGDGRRRVGDRAQLNRPLRLGARLHWRRVRAVD
mmetsp:Transcript_65641/g.180036  ORF Transcript_65641/g.180036 Transcript_65641/m.180036 type:complete len:215 (-) Transcript_65641:1385-2029(-)